MTFEKDETHAEGELDLLADIGSDVTIVFFHRVAAEDEGLVGLLTPLEQRAAYRFHFPPDRTAYVASRMLLRSGFQKLNQRFDSQLSYSCHGKPFIQGAPFHFSLSRTRSIVGCAFARSLIGFDVEDRRRIGDGEDLMEVSLRADERHRLAALPASQRHEALLKTWARKEAVLKAIGRGLSVAPDSFAIEHDATRVDGIPGDWHFYERWLSSHVFSSVAMPHSNSGVRFRDVVEFRRSSLSRASHGLSKNPVMDA